MDSKQLDKYLGGLCMFLCGAAFVMAIDILMGCK